jgi:hypothetical protein
VEGNLGVISLTHNFPNFLKVNMQSLFWGTKLPSLKTHLIEALSLLLSSATATATAFLSSYLINPQTEF